MSGGARKKYEDLRSARWYGVKDLRSFGHRSRTKQLGFDASDYAGKPVIGIVNTWSDMNSCHGHFRQRVEEVKRGVWQAGGFPVELPAISLGEPFMKPSTMLYRNLLSMDTEELLRANPIDGAVLMGGCDKTTPALLMGAASMNIPAIFVPAGPMLRGTWRGAILGSGSDVWKYWAELRAGTIDEAAWNEIEDGIARSPGTCMTMGTASTMMSAAEAIGMTLPGAASIPAADSNHSRMATLSGKRIVEMVWEDLKPSDILTREAFENAIVVNSAIGGSTNCPIHINAIARHVGVKLDMDDWEKIGHHIPLLVNMQPAGEYLGEDYYRAGGVPAVVNALMKAGKIRESAMTVNGKTIGENCKKAKIGDEKVIRTYDKPLMKDAGFAVLRGNLFDSAIMKTSVISDEFQQRYLSNPKDPNAFEGRAIVFEGREDYHKRIEDPALNIDEHCILVVRGVGPIGYPGSAEVVNMQPPAALLKRGITSLPCIGDGRQSGTSGSPSILNASPEAAAGGGLALLKTGDRVRIDLNKGEADILISDEELSARRNELAHHGGFPIPKSQTPWQEIQRSMVDELADGMVLKPAVRYQRVAQTAGVPRDNH
ncbi:MAG: dihydroxy-acid dehydratase family protein [Alphaproteobacteria bacterium]|nr:dihydroxy-acid dehydratase family protein [Alphaproteobacteria bacterium]